MPRGTRPGTVSDVISRLAQRGVWVRGAVGDARPLTAVEDALAEFDADEVIIATHPPGESHWLARDGVERARRR